MPIGEAWCAKARRGRQASPSLGVPAKSKISGGGSRLAGLRQSRLSDLDQVTVRVADVGTDFAPVVFRLGKELCALGRPLLVDPGDVRDPNVEERAREVGVGRWRQRDCRLVVSGAAADVEDQP